MAAKRSRQAFEADLQKQESPFVLYGTPLPPLDGEMRDDGSFVPVWKQEVTDDRGRKRLHGAFTGGFSAGYYNTVGSKEGWTPSAFVSSRQNRMKDSKTAKPMQPEDFMDEEDIRDAEESRQLQTSETFSGFGTVLDEKRRDAFVDLFRPTGETIGVQLLKRMGWREGQQIGQGSRLDPQKDAGKESSFVSNEVVFKQKNDRKGLGFEGEDFTAPSTESRSHDVPQQHDKDDARANAGSLLAQRSTGKNPQKGAFGVGVLDDTGSDDEDPYAMGPHISYDGVIGGEKKPKKKAVASLSTPNPALKSKPVFLSKKLANLRGALRKCHDGRLPLDGFVISDEIEGMATLSLQNEQYKPPDVPVEWKSSLRPIAEREDSLSNPSETLRSSTHDSKSRAALLGESQLPGKSIFDYLSPAARDRLVQASGRRDLPLGQGEMPPDAFQKPQEQTAASLHDLVPRLDQDVALQALNRGVSGWMPYAEDEAKRERYKTYLEIRASFRATSAGDELPPRADGMNQEQWVGEMQEFARAAQVFKPVTGEMASRFTSSTSNLPASADPDSSTATGALLSRRKTNAETPAEAAARMGIFGPMTRSIINFYPTRLVCKRFNVPMPDHTNMRAQYETPQVTPESAAALGKSRFQSGGVYQDNTNHQTAKIVKMDVSDAGSSKYVPEKLGNREDHTPIDPETNEALEHDKPSQDLFKAIFGSDDEDD